MTSAPPAPEQGSPTWLWAAFVAALLFARPLRPTMINPHAVGSMDAFTDPADLQLVVDEGRQQLHDQSERFAHVTGRAQLLVTVTLAAVAFWVGVLALVKTTDRWQHLVAWPLWAAGGAALIIGLAAAAGVVTATAAFDRVDTTMLSNETPGIKHLATEYATAVRRGEITLADRVTAFRQATRLVVWGAILTAFAAVCAL